MTAAAWEVHSQSVAETLALGRRIGAAARPGDVVALVGDLGSGKTHLAKGIAEGLGAARAHDVTSPTFIICHEYLDGRMPFYHLDAYRLHGSADLEAIGADEMLEGDGLAALEWADRAPEALPDDRLDVRLEVTGAETRRIALAPHGPRAERLLAAVRRAAGEAAR
ncbi:MAG: tRNA (adenosine(37)-N6)-threonylcarbamoyltransferase complex ATPase subunit type 1 TsaE [Planctomycetes bacterium]|nr:tRNA (adenosine(37)-N6)-threonylcarbamoyltransferase complex ATPase subunit type 1 TsaE [Planctomycetota bacterium]